MKSLQALHRQPPQIVNQWYWLASPAPQLLTARYTTAHALGVGLFGEVWVWMGSHLLQPGHLEAAPIGFVYEGVGWFMIGEA
jgi:hypothetical protein